MKNRSKDRTHSYGKYLVEYRNERGDLFFYKREQLNNIEEAMSVKNKLELQGFHDIRIINKDVLVS